MHIIPQNKSIVKVDTLYFSVHLSCSVPFCGCQSDECVSLPSSDTTFECGLPVVGRQ